MNDCPEGVLPDGPICPRCGERRGPSGVDGGSWVHCPAHGAPPADAKTEEWWGAWNMAIEEAAKRIERGSFLHNASPAYKFAQEAAAAIRMLKDQVAAPARPAPEAPTIEQAEAMGKNGSPHSESERLLYEAYCRGHCWNVGPWVPKDDGGEYYEMTDRVRFAMWRDRAALSAAAEGKQP